ncbi:MAG: DUF1667 domain-containing protein [Clostridium sp.]
MENKELTCIGCPKGCHLTVSIENNEVLEVKGFSCKVGEEYGKTECTNPTRIVTSIIKVTNGEVPMVPCKTSSPIPKNKIFEVLKEIKPLTVNAPISIGDILIENVCNTNSNIIATREIKVKST